MEQVYRIKLQYPNATYVGIADGAEVNWGFLECHTQYQVLDFFHATEYLAEASHTRMYAALRENQTISTRAYLSSRGTW